MVSLLRISFLLAPSLSYIYIRHCNPIIYLQDFSNSSTDTTYTSATITTTNTTTTNNNNNNTNNSVFVSLSVKEDGTE